jgi:branched-chain amino acid transport system substrate-binding protein
MMSKAPSTGAAMKNIVTAAVMSGLIAILSGAHAAENEFVFGHVAGHTGVQAVTAKGLRDGILLYFDQVNARGGVNGSKLVLESIDDQYDPVKTVAAVKKLMAEPRVIALLATLGTENNDALVKSHVLDGSSFVNFGPRAATNVLEPSLETYRIRASYRDEMRAIVSQLNVAGIKNLGLVLQGDGLGKEGEQALVLEAATANIKVSTRHAYDRSAGDVTGAVTAMRASNADAIVFVGISKACADFLAQYHKQGGAMPVYAISVVDPNVVVRLSQGNGDGRGLIVAQTMPAPTRRALPLIREIHAALAATKTPPEMSYGLIEGFVVGKAAVEVLSRATAKNRDGFRNALKNLNKEIDLGGLAVNFTGGKRDGGNYVELSVIGEGGRIRN